MVVCVKIKDLLKKSKLLCSLLLVIPWVGCYRGRLDDRILKRTEHRAVNLACLDIDLQDTQLSVSQVRTMMRCFNQFGALQKTERWINGGAGFPGRSDGELQLMLDTVKTQVLSQPRRLHEIEQSYQTFHQLGLGPQVLERWSGLIQDPKLLMLGLQEAGALLQAHPQLFLRSLQTLGGALEAKKVESFLQLAIETARAPAFAQLLEAMSGARPGQSAEGADGGAALFRAAHAFLFQDAPKARFEELSWLAWLRKSDAALTPLQRAEAWQRPAWTILEKLFGRDRGRWPEKMAQAEGLLAALLQTPPQPQSLPARPRIVELADSVRRLSQPIPCLQQSVVIPDGTLYLLQEISLVPEADWLNYLLAKGKLSLLATQPFCQFPKGMNRIYQPWVDLALLSLEPQASSQQVRGTSATVSLLEPLRQLIPTLVGPVRASGQLKPGGGGRRAATADGDSFLAKRLIRVLTQASRLEARGGTASQEVGLFDLIPALQEVSKRKVLSAGLLWLASLSEQEQAAWGRLFLALNEPRAELRGPGLEPSSHDPLSLLDVLVLGIKDVPVAQTWALVQAGLGAGANRPGRIADLLEPLIWALQLNSAHPLLEVVQATLQAAPESQTLFETLFRFGSEPEFAASLQEMAGLAGDGRLKSIVDALFKLFRPKAVSGPPILVASKIPPVTARQQQRPQNHPHDRSHDQAPFTGLLQDLPSLQVGQYSQGLAFRYATSACASLDLDQGLAHPHNQDFAKCWELLDPSTKGLAAALGKLSQSAGARQKAGQRPQASVLAQSTQGALDLFQALSPASVQALLRSGLQQYATQGVPPLGRWLEQAQAAASHLGALVPRVVPHLSFSLLMQIYSHFVSQQGGGVLTRFLQREDGLDFLQASLRWLRFQTSWEGRLEERRFWQPWLENAELQALLQEQNGKEPNSRATNSTRVLVSSPRSLSVKTKTVITAARRVTTDDRLVPLPGSAQTSASAPRPQALSALQQSRWDGTGHRPATHSTWVELYDNPRLRYLVGRLAGHPEWVESVLIRYLKFFSLAPGEAPSQDKHYPPEYFLRWLHRRAVDYRPLKYYYVNDELEPGLLPWAPPALRTNTKHAVVGGSSLSSSSSASASSALSGKALVEGLQPRCDRRVFDCLPRVILENSLGRLSKTVVNTDFPMPEPDLLVKIRGQSQSDSDYDLSQPAGLTGRMRDYLSGFSWWKRGAQFVAARTPTAGKWMSLTFSQEIALAFGDIADRALWPPEIQELYPAPARPKTLKQAVAGILARSQKSEDLSWLTALYGPPQDCVAEESGLEQEEAAALATSALSLPSASPPPAARSRLGKVMSHGSSSVIKKRGPRHGLKAYLRGRVLPDVEVLQRRLYNLNQVNAVLTENSEVPECLSDDCEARDFPASVPPQPGLAVIRDLFFVLFVAKMPEDSPWHYRQKFQGNDGTVDPEYQNPLRLATEAVRLGVLHQLGHVLREQSLEQPENARFFTRLMQLVHQPDQAAREKPSATLAAPLPPTASYFLEGLLPQAALQRGVGKGLEILQTFLNTRGEPHRAFLQMLDQRRREKPEKGVGGFAQTLEPHVATLVELWEGLEGQGGAEHSQLLARELKQFLAQRLENFDLEQALVLFFQNGQAAHQLVLELQRLEASDSGAELLEMIWRSLAAG